MLFYLSTSRPTAGPNPLRVGALSLTDDGPCVGWTALFSLKRLIGLSTAIYVHNTPSLNPAPWLSPAPVTSNSKTQQFNEASRQAGRQASAGIHTPSLLLDTCCHAARLKSPPQIINRHDTSSSKHTHTHTHTHTVICLHPLELLAGLALLGRPLPVRLVRALRV